MMRLGRSLAVFFVSAALFAGPAEESGTSEQGVSDSEIGLAKVSVFEVAIPDPVILEVGDPGDGAPLPRPYIGSPPRVPHSVADFEPITRAENLCVECHLIDEAGEGDPTPIPQTHRVDWRNAPTVVREGIAGARYNCTACHVRKTEAEPLVGVTEPE